MTDTLEHTQPSPPPAGRTAPDPVAARLRLAGEILVTLGVVLALFVVYEVWVTNWLTQGRQDDASGQLVREFAGPQAGGPATDAGIADGTPVARLTLPSLGRGHSWAVVQGTGAEQLATGPGHYTGTAMPGRTGNFAVAGHRVTRGAPFHDVGDLHSCDPLVVETATGWSVYRVLPFAEEAPTWATGRGTAPACRGLAPLDPAVVGREVVAPSQVDVVDAVPHQPGRAGTLPLITLTTCDPPFSARQRLVVHGVLDRVVPKTPGGGLPPELLTADD